MDGGAKLFCVVRTEQLNQLLNSPTERYGGTSVICRLTCRVFTVSSVLHLGRTTRNAGQRNVEFNTTESLRALKKSSKLTCGF